MMQNNLIVGYFREVKLLRGMMKKIINSNTTVSYSNKFESCEKNNKLICVDSFWNLQ